MNELILMIRPIVRVAEMLRCTCELVANRSETLSRTIAGLQKDEARQSHCFRWRERGGETTSGASNLFVR